LKTVDTQPIWADLKKAEAKNTSLKRKERTDKATKSDDGSSSTGGAPMSATIDLPAWLKKKKVVEGEHTLPTMFITDITSE
jgi:hypothetical protein